MSKLLSPCRHCEFDNTCFDTSECDKHKKFIEEIDKENTIAYNSISLEDCMKAYEVCILSYYNYDESKCDKCPIYLSGYRNGVCEKNTIENIFNKVRIKLQK